MTKINQQLIFAKNLKSVLAKKNITQDKLAKKIDVSSAMISKYTKGKTPPSFETLIAISDALHVSIDFLVGNSKLETSNDCERAFAEKYNLDQETLDGFMDSLNNIKNFSDSLDSKEIGKFIDEFLKSNLIQNLMFSTFIVCLKKDALIAARKSEELLNVDLDKSIDDLDKSYIPFCEKIFEGTTLCPNKLIDSFAENYSLCFSDKDKDTLNKATSITNLSDISRKLNSSIGTNFFIILRKYVSAYVRGTLPQIMGEQAKYVVEEHAKKVFYKNGDIK